MIGTRKKMNSIYLPLYGDLATSKITKYISPRISGLEICSINDNQALEEIKEFSIRSDLIVGIHYPLFANRPKGPMLLSSDKTITDSHWRILEDDIKEAAHLNAQYFLIHVPKPVLVNRNIDLQYWRFSDKKDWQFSDQYMHLKSTLCANIEIFFSMLSKLSKKYNIKIYLENDLISTNLDLQNILCSMLEKYNQIKLCLDIGRLHLQAALDVDFSILQFIQLLGKCTRHVHLWNSSKVHNITGGHYPAIKRLDNIPGWADVAEILKAIKCQSDDFSVLLEHHLMLLKPAEAFLYYEYVQFMLEEK